MRPEPVTGKALFIGLVLSQLVTLIVLAIITSLALEFDVAKATTWGAGICFLAYMWAGFQMWLNPRNKVGKRRSTTAIRAEVGKVTIALLLLGISIKTVPEFREKTGAAALLLGFFITQVAGSIWLARATTVPTEQEVGK